MKTLNCILYVAYLYSNNLWMRISLKYKIRHISVYFLVSFTEVISILLLHLIQLKNTYKTIGPFSFMLNIFVG